MSATFQVHRSEEKTAGFFIFFDTFLLTSFRLSQFGFKFQLVCFNHFYRFLQTNSFEYLKKKWERGASLLVQISW